MSAIVNGTQILAVAGILSALSVMLGGMIDVPVLVGLGGGIMFFGNILALGVESVRKPKQPG